jgi:hypothetical protein
MKQHAEQKRRNVREPFLFHALADSCADSHDRPLEIQTLPVRDSSRLKLAGHIIQSVMENVLVDWSRA